MSVLCLVFFAPCLRQSKFVCLVRLSTTRAQRHCHYENDIGFSQSLVHRIQTPIVLCTAVLIAVPILVWSCSHYVSVMLGCILLLLSWSQMYHFLISFCNTLQSIFLLGLHLNRNSIHCRSCSRSIWGL